MSVVWHGSQAPARSASLDCTYLPCLPLRSSHDGRGRSLGQQRASRATGALNSEPNPHLRFLKQLGPPGTCQCPWRAAQNRGGTPLLLARDTAAPRPSSSSQASSFPLPAAAVRARGRVGGAVSRCRARASRASTDHCLGTCSLLPNLGGLCMYGISDQSTAALC